MHHPHVITWATDCLIAQGYTLPCAPNLHLSTPWSLVIRFATTTGDIYLKQTAPAIFLSLEPKIIDYLSEKFPSNLPVILAVNHDLHCFLMKDAGTSLRAVLKRAFKLDLLCQAMKQYAKIQRATESHITPFLSMGVPDWRPDKLPFLYDQMIHQIDFLRAEGMTEKDLQMAHDLRPQVLAQCTQLSRYGIPETFGQHDFHDNNVLMDGKTGQMTFIDFGETAIICPFFSLNTCLRQSITHHGIKEGDRTYRALQDACLENWAEFTSIDQLEELFIFVKKLWPIYSAISCYQLIVSVDLQAFRTFYNQRPAPITGLIKEYIQSYR